MKKTLKFVLPMLLLGVMTCILVIFLSIPTASVSACGGNTIGYGEPYNHHGGDCDTPTPHPTRTQPPPTATATEPPPPPSPPPPPPTVTPTIAPTQTPTPTDIPTLPPPPPPPTLTPTPSPKPPTPTPTDSPNVCVPESVDTGKDWYQMIRVNSGTEHYGYWKDGIYYGVCSIKVANWGFPSLQEKIDLCECGLPADYVWDYTYANRYSIMKNSCSGDETLKFEGATTQFYGNWQVKYWCTTEECPIRKH